MPDRQTSTSPVETIEPAELIASHSVEWHERRRLCIGASDGYPILTGDALRIYLEKTRPYDPRSEPPPTYHQLRGRLLEPVIGKLWSRQHGRRIRRQGHRTMNGESWLGCNLDYQVLATEVEPTSTLEVKAPMSYVHDKIVEGGFRESTAIQTMIQLAVYGYSKAYFAAGCFETTPPMVTFSVERDDVFLTMLVDLLRRFWHEHVVPRIPPDPDEWNILGKELVASIGDLRTDRRVLEDADLAWRALSYAQSRQHRKQAEETKNEHGAELKEHMAALDVDQMIVGGGRWKIGYKAPKPKESLDTATLTMHRPIDRDAFVRWVRGGSEFDEVLNAYDLRYLAGDEEIDSLADCLALDTRQFIRRQAQAKRLTVYDLKGDL